MGGSNLWIQQTTINGFMIGYDRPLNFFTFLDLRHVQGTREWGGGVGADQSWTKKVNFGSVQCDLKLKILKDYSNRFFSVKLLSLVKILVSSNHNWVVRAPKPPKTGHVMDTELICKALKIFILTNHKYYTNDTYHDCLSLLFGQTCLKDHLYKTTTSPQ